MFTGITQGLYPIVFLQRYHHSLRYAVDLGEVLCKGIKIGASIAIDGICQTVVEEQNGIVTLEAIAETLERTTLNSLEKGREVSVERSLRFGEEVGGHLLSGHIFERAILLEKKREKEEVALKIGVSSEAIRAIFEKGYIGVDGSSLTVGKVDLGEPAFWVHLIPETLRLTRLGKKVPGEFFNLELDANNLAIVDTVERTVKRMIDPIEKRLRRLEQGKASFTEKKHS